MPGAHHLPDGSFRNPWPEDGVPGFRGGMRMMREFREARRNGAGDGAPERVAPAVTHPRGEARHFSATWIGHSSTLLQVGGLNVLTDPVFAERASPVQWLGPRRLVPPGLDLAGLPPIDVVLVSHNHYDHLDKAAVRRLARARPDTAWVAPLRLGDTLRNWGARHVVELDWWQSVDVDGLSVTATPARHFSSRGFHDRNRTLWCGFALALDGWRAWFAGDTAYHGDFAEVGVRTGPFDFVMLPIGAYEPRWFMSRVHADPDEAVQIYQDVRSAHPEAQHPLMLGIHWGTFRLTTEPVDEPPLRVAARWSAEGLDPARLWIPRVGETKRV